MTYGYLTPTTWQRKQAQDPHGTGSLLFDIERKRNGSFAEKAGQPAPRKPSGKRK